jgi:DNA-binding beta-propeller fold protein YncE
MQTNSLSQLFFCSLTTCKGSCRHRRVFLSLLVLFISGCAGAPKQAAGPIFYPPLPNPPRVQYLKSFSTERDLGKSSDFSDFILGKDTDAERLINKPYGVALADGQLFVVDTRGPSYVIFDLKNKRVKTVYGSGPGRMKKPINIIVDKSGNRFVSDTDREQILEFDKNDNFVRAFGRQGQFKPTDMAILDDKMFVVDIAHYQVHVLSLQDGHTLKIFGKPGSKPDELFQPTNITIGPDGYLYVSDTGNFRVQKISQDGKFVKSIGQVGTGLGQFARPKGISVDHDDHLYVVDAAFENVQVFNQEGRLLLYFAGPGPHPDNLNLPTDIEIDYANVALFQQYADPNFKLEYVILVANQFGKNKVNVYGFGKMQGMSYDTDISIPK